MNGLRFLGMAVGTLGLAACAPAVSQADLDQVRRLANVPVLPQVVGRSVEPTVDADVRRWLARPLDEAAAVRIALLNNRGLRASLLELGVARGRLVQAGLLPNPHIDLEKPVEPEIRYDLGLEVNLTQALLASVRSRAAAADLDAERFRAAASVLDLGLDVRTAFYAVQAAEQRLRLAQQSLEALAAARDAVRMLADAGNTPRLGLASQEAAYERTRVLVAAVELDVATARERLNRLMGVHGGGTTWKTAGSLPGLPEVIRPVQEAEIRALESSLALAEARSRLEATARRTGLSRTEGWLPQISVSGRVAELEAEPGGHGGRRYGAGVSLSVPLFDRNQGNADALTAEFDALMERYHASAIDVRSQARETEARLTSAGGRARQYETVILPAQKRLGRETLLQFNAMQIGVFQLLQARREELDVELAYVEALEAYWSADARMDAILQGGTGGSPPVSGASPGRALSSTNTSEGGH